MLKTNYNLIRDTGAQALFPSLTWLHWGTLISLPVTVSSARAQDYHFQPVNLTAQGDIISKKDFGTKILKKGTLRDQHLKKGTFGTKSS